ncbi:F-box/kelch-repeat protein At3g06240-like [Papaver somniferum]|uniref:F-box/kelch-repeat protein At3g06240-like n=1 Tax=Papaver somniferum TaxID=3469 RepID=UPI000E6FDF8D|nr:F-box/kelch-repeat protein At3g06240-like [Papaver somniferum]
MLIGRKLRSIDPMIICSVAYDALSSRFARNDLVVRNAIEYDYPFRSLGQDIVLLGCCHGLVCMQVSYMVFKDFLCVWNPCTKEYKVIPDEKIEDETAYAFGYDSTIDDYKLFKVIQIPAGSIFCLVDVYTLGSNSWRSIEDITYCFHNEKKVGVLANGNLHWLGWSCKITDTQIVERSKVISSLDVSNERFHEMQLAKEPLENEHNFRSLGVLEGRLCVLFHDDSKLDLWVMQDYGVQESWTKQFSIMKEQIRDRRLISLMWSFKNNEDHKYLICAEHDLFLYEPKQARVRRPEINGLRSLHHVENHFESLVSLGSGTYVGR